MTVPAVISNTVKAAETEYSLSVNIIGSGVVTVNGSSPYAAGSIVVMTAYPSDGWTFSGWSGDLTGMANPDTILMDSNKSVTVTFTEIPLNFDFGTAASPVASGYTRVTDSTVYSAGLGYGWTSTSNVGSRDRGAPDNLKRDLVFSRSDRGFNVDLADGEYTVEVIIGDNSYRHDNIDVYAEGDLKVNDLSVSAGSFVEQTFGVVVSDGQLNLVFVDDGGSDVNWVINAITIETGAPPPKPMFDFGTSTSPVASGYTRVTESTVYSLSLGYGWTSGVFGSRDRGAPDNLKRDLVFSRSDRGFNVDLANGEYTVKVIIGDNKYMHDNIDIYAEGALMLNDVTVSAGSFVERTFGVEVTDGQLNLMFVDDGGTDVNWVINAIEITPGPPPFWRGYDFGTASSPLEPGYIRISHYKSRDRGAPDNSLRRDFIFDSSDATFVPWDIPNGDYLVTVTIGDQKYRHDNIDVYAEGALKLNDVTVNAGQFITQTFTVTLSDGELNIRFHDDGGTDLNWVVNALTIESAP